MDWILKHKLAAFLMIAAIAGLAWYMLEGSSPSSSAVLSAEGADAVPPDAQNLVQSLDALHAITLDGQIFTNPAFHALQDFSTPVVPEPVGRVNPFAPLSASEIAGGSSPSTSR